MNTMPRIIYPASWSQSAREALDELFAKARASDTWFYHSGVSGTFWFSPDELQAEQQSGNFVWGAVNWQLRNPLEGLEAIDRGIENLRQERMKFADRMHKALAG